MTTRLTWPALLLCAAALPARAELSGTWEQEWAAETANGDIQKFEASIQPEWNSELQDDLLLTAVARLRLDTEARLGPADRPDTYSSLNGPWLNGAHGQLELREFYLDTEWRGAYWRLGKQQVVWGQADGLKVLDQINPQSFREFILDEFDDSRIPLWMLNLELALEDDSNLQLLWIPDTSYHELPQNGSPWVFTSPAQIPRAPAGVPVSQSPLRKPSRFFRDSEWGLRYSAFIRGWDITLNYLYHYGDFPVLFQDQTADGVRINPGYERTHLVGGTLSNAFGDVTLRTEIGYSTDSYHLSGNISRRGIHRSAELASVIGLDWQGLPDSLISVQWFQSHLLDDDSAVIRDRTEHTLTLLYERTFANETWTFETLALHATHNGDGLIRPKLSHSLLSNLEIWVGADLFYGDAEGLFGQFDNNDRLTLGFEWGF